jgi:hypothetical protein
MQMLLKMHVRMLYVAALTSKRYHHGSIYAISGHHPVKQRSCSECSTPASDMVLATSATDQLTASASQLEPLLSDCESPGADTA